MLAMHADSPEQEERFVRAQDLTWRTIPGVAVLLLRGLDQETVVLAGTGLQLWEELAVPRRLDEVTLDFAERYGIAPDVVAGSLRTVLQELRDLGVVCHDG